MQISNVSSKLTISYHLSVDQNSALLHISQRQLWDTFPVIYVFRCSKTSCHFPKTHRTTDKICLLDLQVPQVVENKFHINVSTANSFSQCIFARFLAVPLCSFADLNTRWVSGCRSNRMVKSFLFLYLSQDCWNLGNAEIIIITDHTKVYT